MILGKLVRELIATRQLRTKLKKLLTEKWNKPTHLIKISPYTSIELIINIRKEKAKRTQALSAILSDE